jgi:hypothetical protein
MKEYLKEEIKKVIEEAVLKEREECAQLAENWGNAPPNPNGRRAALARAIRERGNQ